MRRLIQVFRAAGQRFSHDGCAFLAQAIAYNAAFALFPLALLAIAVLAFLYGSHDGQARALGLVDDFAPEFHDLIAENLTSLVSFSGLSGAVGLLMLVWSGKNLFMALAYALNRALGVPADRPLVHNIVLSIVMLPVIGVILIVGTALPPLLSIATNAIGISFALAQVASYGISILLVFAVSALLYTFLPNRRLSWRFGLPGAAFTAIAFALGQLAFTLYAAHTNLLHVYGVISGVLALMLWFYLMGVIFLFGAQISAELSPVRREEESAAA